MFLLMINCILSISSLRLVLRLRSAFDWKSDPFPPMVVPLNANDVIDLVVSLGHEVDFHFKQQRFHILSLLLGVWNASRITEATLSFAVVILVGNNE